MSDETASAVGRLEALDARVLEAERRVRELELERERAGRVHDRALGPLRDYWREVEAEGGEGDPEREAELLAELERRTRHVTRRPVLIGGRVSEFVAVDERVEARIAGANEALERARRERDSFLQRHRAELVAEALPDAEAAAGELAAHHEAAAAAGGAYREAARRLHRYGIDADELPDAPAVDRREVAALRRLADRGLHRPEADR